jgi:hypothetical protein
MGCFCLSYNSRSSEAFVGWVVNLSPMVVWCFWTAFRMLFPQVILMHACWISSDPIFHHAFQFPHDIYIKCVYGLQDIGGVLHVFNLLCAFAVQSKFLKYAHLQGEFFYILQSNSSNSVLTLHIIIPVENLTYLSSITKKGEIVSASSAP